MHLAVINGVASNRNSNLVLHALALRLFYQHTLRNACQFENDTTKTRVEPNE